MPAKWNHFADQDSRQSTCWSNPLRQSLRLLRDLLLDEFGSSRSKLINVIDSNILAQDSREKPVSTFSHPALDCPAARKRKDLANEEIAVGAGKKDRERRALPSHRQAARRNILETQRKFGRARFAFGIGCRVRHIVL